MPEVHACTFDFRAASDAVLTKQLVRVTGEKMERF
jgi:hypothetical protein